MGGAKAALTVGYRGNKYGGPNKAAALEKLKALYHAEGMSWTAKEEFEQRIVKGAGASQAIAFISSVPTFIDMIRNEPLTGLDGAALRDIYLEPLRLTREDVFVSNLVPISLGRLPSDEEIELWRGWRQAELTAIEPKVVIALGKQAAIALGATADIFLPHPNAVRRKGDSGEVRRKLARVQRLLKDACHKSNSSVYLKGKSRSVRQTTEQDSVELAFLKADEMKQIVLGEVSVPNESDSQGDFMSAEDIEEIAHAYLRASRVVGLEHKKAMSPVLGAQVVESYIVPVDLEIEGQPVVKGTWVMAVHVADPIQWARVESGELTGFSIGGHGIRVSDGK